MLNRLRPYATFYKAKIIRGLEIRGSYGYLTLNTLWQEGTIFKQGKNYANYKILRHLKTTGEANHEYKIVRCDIELGAFDLTILIEDNIVTSIKTPIEKINMGLNP